MIGMVGKILGLNKKSDYFIEFGDGKESNSTQAQSAPEETKPAPEETKPAPVEAKVQEEAPAPEKASKKAKTTKKAKATSAPAPEAEQTAKAKPAPAKPKEQPSFNNGLKPTPAGMTFATDYLVKPSSAGRRRPGPSMNMFRDMARQVGRR